MKKLLAALLIAPLFWGGICSPAFAQKTKAQLTTEVSTTFPDNTSGQITPSGVRTFQNDLINSIMPTAPVVSGNLACFSGTTGLLQDCGSAPATVPLTIGLTPVNSAVTGNVLAVNGTLLGQYSISGTGSVAMTVGPSFTTPALGTPSAAVLTNATGLPISTGLTGTGTGVITALGVNVGTAGSVVVNGGALGTPSSGVLTNATGLPLATGVTGTLQAAQFPALTGDVTTSAGSLSSTISTSAVTNTKLAAAPAYTLKGNATASSASPTDISIPALTQKVSLAAGDYVMIADSAASNQLKYALVSSLASAGSVSSINGQTGAITSYFEPQGRLTLQTATPVMTTTQSGKTTIYYTPHHGNMVPIYDGANMVPTAVAEISVATTDTTKNPAAIGASKVNDWFVWNDAGTIRLSHGPDWTNDTTRSAGTALTMVNGILLNNASITNGPAASRGTYVGTTRSNGSSQLDYIFGASASGGTAAFFGVWNCYNRVSTGTNVIDSGVSYTYATGTVRQARASAGNQISFVLGLAEDAVQASYVGEISVLSAANSAASFGLGFDSTTAYGVQRVIIVNQASSITQRAGLSVSAPWSPGIGLHVLSANEQGDGTNSNTFNISSLNSLSAMIRN